MKEKFKKGIGLHNDEWVVEKFTRCTRDEKLYFLRKNHKHSSQLWYIFPSSVFLSTGWKEEIDWWTRNFKVWLIIEEALVDTELVD